jgi:hypothetical protein
LQIIVIALAAHTIPVHLYLQHSQKRWMAQTHYADVPAMTLVSIGIGRKSANQHKFFLIAEAVTWSLSFSLIHLMQPK